MHYADRLARWAGGPTVRVALLAGLGWALVLGGLAVGRYGGDLRAFICAGERMRHPPALAAVPRTSPWGYDGQFYATVATDPLLLKAETARGLDNPSYRARRVLVPLLAWVAAAGRPAAALVTYPLLCWAGGLWLIALVGGWPATAPRPARWALLVALSGGVVTSMLRCTPDAFAVAAMLAAVALHRRERPAGALALSVVATLARETSLLVGAVLAWEELRRRRPGRAAAYLALPGAALGLWQAWLTLGRGLPGPTLGTNLGLPGLGLAGKLAAFFAGRAGFSFMELLGVLAVLGTLAACAALPGRHDGERPALALYGLWCALALCLGRPVYEDGFAYSRVLLALPALALVGRAGETSTWRRRLLLVGPGAFALMGLVMLKGEFVPVWPWLADLSRPLRTLFARP